jgi:hypothetical protein
MEQAHWTFLRRVFGQACREQEKLRRAQYSDLLILKLYFWAVFHDRPMTWVLSSACYYTRFFPRRKFPSISQLNRRIASDRFQGLLRRVHELLSQSDKPVSALFIDGKPLPVGVRSGDREAHAGPCGPGYKLHAIVTQDGRIPLFL